MERKTRGISIVAALLALGGICSAGPINGSLPLTGVDITQNGANLSVSTLISATDTITSGAGSGDYTVVPLFTDFGPSTLDTTDLDAFTISSATYGSFGSVTIGEILTQNANFLDVYLVGTFTPGSGLAAGLDPTLSSLRISINQSGSSLSEAMTLSSPPAGTGVPEPATFGLLGGSLAALGLYRRKPGSCK